MKLFRFYKHRSNYWSCSKFANFIRGENKLKSGTMEEWDEWSDKCKDKHPFRYWLAESGLDYIQDFIYYPYDVYRTIRRYIRHRFITKTHQLNSKLKKGEYHELSDRFLYCCFDELVNFIKVEKAWMNYICNKGVKDKKGELGGLDYLKWEASLVYEEEYSELYKKGEPTHQAITAKEIIELYYWWKYIRPNRIDPYDMYDEDEEDWCIKVDEMENKYYMEDEEMLIRLIKVRNGLWT